MHLNLCASPVRSISVQLPTRPSFHPSYFQLDLREKEIVRNIDTTYTSDNTWIDMGRAIKFIKRIQQFQSKYGIQNLDHPHTPLLHSLTKSNIKKKHLQLPKRAMCNLIDEAGSIRILLSPSIDFTSTYKSTVDDGITINGWRHVLKQTKFKVGDKLIFIHHQNSQGVFLFLTRI